MILNYNLMFYSNQFYMQWMHVIVNNNCQQVSIAISRLHLAAINCYGWSRSLRTLYFVLLIDLPRASMKILVLHCNCKN